MATLTPVEMRIQKARTALLLDHPFFGSLLCRLSGQECRSIATMATDGISLFYNPAFVDTLSSATLCGVLAHEVMHPALHHHLRRSGRSVRRWNEACDYAINLILLGDGLSLPEGVLVDDRFRGISAERIYNILCVESAVASRKLDRDSALPGIADASHPNLESGSGQCFAPVSDGGVGQVIDAPSGADMRDPEEQAREWSIAVSQSTSVAKQAGKLPSGVARALEGIVKASVDWREMLRRLWSDTVLADYSWVRPNRRHIWAGLYLPGVVREGVGEIAIAVDCSGSLSARHLGLFEAEVCSILDGQRPQRVHVLYFDSVVQKVDTYIAGEQVRLSPVGGGGTHFEPCFEWLHEHGIAPQTLIFLTDLYGSFPLSAPPYPVLWASTGSQEAPFGQIIPMQAA